MSGALLAASGSGKIIAAAIDQGNDAYQSNDDDGQTVTGTLAINSDGSIAYTGDSNGTSESGQSWLNRIGANNGDGFHTRLVFVSGDNSYNSGSALNTWHAMTSGRTYSYQKLTGGGSELESGTWRLDVSKDGGSTTDATNTFTVDMFEQSP